jgi:hypothetical protein
MLSAFLQYSAVLLAELFPHSSWHAPLEKLHHAISQGRKVQRIGRWTQPLRRLQSAAKAGFNSSIAQTVRAFDMAAHAFTVQYFVLDNLIFLSTVGIFASHASGAAKNGWLVEHLGGVSGMKKWRNIGSVARAAVGIPAAATLALSHFLRRAYFRSAARQRTWSEASVQSLNKLEDAAHAVIHLDESASGQRAGGSRGTFTGTAHIIELARSITHLLLLRMKINDNIAHSRGLVVQSSIRAPLLALLGLALGYLKRVLPRDHVMRGEATKRSVSAVSLLSVDSFVDHDHDDHD